VPNIDTEAIARSAFAEIAQRFPNLHFAEDEGTPVEVSITAPAQEGLRHKIWLALQNNDELHFSVEHFWLEWFPCTDPQRVKEYISSVVGFLSGDYRIIEHYRGTRCVKAQLQRPTNGGWSTIGTWSRLNLPIPWATTCREVRNA